MEARPTLVVRTEVVFKEIFTIDTRLKQLGIEAESLLNKTKHMNEEYGEYMRNEFKHLENIVRKAKAGVLVSEVKVRSSSQKSADIRIKDIAGRASLTVPSATLLMCQ